MLDPIHRIADLLESRRRAADPGTVDRELFARHGVTQAVLISDLSGFSRITARLGLGHALELIDRMRSVCRPVIVAHGGRVLKMDADNLMALFPDANRALAAAAELHQVCGEDARGRPEDARVRLCVGVGFGPMLDLEVDVFGSEVNLASKLGEDLALPRETLVTESAAAAVDPLRWRLVPREVTASGLVLRHYALDDLPARED